MKPLQKCVALLTLGLMTSAIPAEAAWDNVFQVTCWGHHRSSSNYCCPAPTPSFYAAPAGGCCDPCQTCTTRYVQRCYYQPVTCYQTKTYYEPITTYTTRTYYEPVTTYRYSCYYDPCTCSYQQVACPVTSYVARQQCCPVQSWVQRCCQVAVTTYQKSFYWEPQTTCCSAPACPAPCSTGGSPVPQVDQRQTGPPPQVDSGSGSDTGKYYQGGSQQSQFRQMPPLPGTGTGVPAQQPKQPSIKLERIAQSEGSGVGGQIVNDERTPRSGVQVTFASANKQTSDRTVTSNAAGRFDVDLPSGEWLVYMRTADGQQVYHSRIEVTATQKTPIVLVSR
jgi:hypothetical protein